MQLVRQCTVELVNAPWLICISSVYSTAISRVYRLAMRHSQSHTPPDRLQIPLSTLLAIQRRVAVATIALVAFVPSTQHAYAQNQLAECLPVLAKDYYSIAEQTKQREDYLKTIDAESWSQLKTSKKTSASLFDLFSFDDSYDKFSEKRDRYLESQKYTRTIEQARQVLSIVTSERAYPAYEACLRTASTGAPLRVWVSSETMESLSVRVRYNNPPGVKSMKLEGWITGGSVERARAGASWNGARRWGVNQEVLLKVNRAPGTAQTTIRVASADGATPVELQMARADGVLRVVYNGSVDVFRQHVRAEQDTPHNDSKSACRDKVGMHDGKWCTSRTIVTLLTAAPRKLKNVGYSQQAGHGCQWSAVPAPARLENEGLRAVGEIHNRGPSCKFIVTADEYETLGAAQCGGEAVTPVVAGVPVALSVRNDCIGIAQISWQGAAAAGAGAIGFGSDGAGS